MAVGMSSVVAMVPYLGNKVLLQLRDEKPTIVFPGKWGFFSGGINQGEMPRQAALRELFEELCYRPELLLKLGTAYLPEHHVISHVYYCRLHVPLHSLSQQEGMDFGLFSWEEITSKRLYSAKMKQWYPVIDTPFVFQSIRSVLEKVGHGGKNTDTV